tara:strand:- start:1416 stop:2291 length:876 start_codon:yes stop_codon:yes gene_type:complete
MKKVLIFGGYGFIGNKIYHELKNNYVVSRYTSLNKHQKNKIKYSYENFYKIIKNFKPDIIFFLSGTSNPDYKNINHLYDFKKTNIVLQSFLFALKNLNFKGKIFFFSTIGVYGTNSKKTLGENDSLNPESFYTLSKTLAENQCNYFASNYKLNVNILRICSIFGPGLNRQIVYKIIKKVKDKNNIIKLLGNKNDKRELLFIDDLILIIKKLISAKIKREVINIGSNKQYFIKDIVKKVLLIEKKEKKIIFINKIKTPKFPLLKNRKLYKFIKIKKKFDINVGLKKTIMYYC